MICKSCGETKSPDLFATEIRRGAVYTKPTCKPCTNRKKRESYARGNNRQTPEQASNNRLKSLFGITLEKKLQMLEQQGGCAICGTTEPGGNGWAVDHDHTCCPDGNRKTCGNCVRGILCHHCNALLGYAKDNPETLYRAAVYLHQNQNVLGVPNG